MVLDPIPQILPVHFFGSRPQPPTSRRESRILSRPRENRVLQCVAVCCSENLLCQMTRVKWGEGRLHMYIYLCIFIYRYVYMFIYERADFLRFSLVIWHSRHWVGRCLLRNFVTRKSFALSFFLAFFERLQSLSRTFDDSHKREVVLFTQEKLRAHATKRDTW